MTRLYNWLSSRPGLLLSSALILALASVEIYSYVQTHKAVYLVLAVFMLALVTSTVVQLYRHRRDPTWPPKRVLVPRNQRYRSQHVG